MSAAARSLRSLALRPAPARGFCAAASPAAASEAELGEALELAGRSLPRRLRERKGVRYPSDTFVMLHPGRELKPNQVVFKVPMTYNKFQIRSYLEEIYKVKVTKVETAVILGKSRRNLLVNDRLRLSKSPDWKKAYVTVDAPVGFPEDLLSNRAQEREAQEREEKAASRQ